jgi:hypothetical protein
MTMYRNILILCITFLIALIPLTAGAVEFGWQALPDGGIEYLVQIEPDLLNSFISDGFTSEIPASLQRDMRSIRITVGSGKLPNQGDVTGPKPSAVESNGGTAATSSVMAPSRSAAAPDGSNSQPAGQSDNSGTLQLPPPPEPNGAPSQAPGESRQNSDNSTSTSQSSQTQASENPPAQLPSLPFFQNGQIRKLQADNASPAADSTTPTVPAEQTTRPRLNENAGSKNEPRAFESDHLEIGAAKPAVFDTTASPNKPAANPTATSTPAKPWMPLMAALLALFASLGANVYLSWIHVAVRAKYRALVQRIAPATTAV